MGTDGKVSHVNVTKYSHPLFRSASENAVAQWRFAPAVKDGKAVAVHMAIPLQYEMKN